MPIFEIENPQTKQIVKIEADRAPTQEEAQEFLSAVPVSTTAGTPDEALSRFKENAQLTQLLGGEPIGTGGKTYSETQGVEDAKLIRRQLLNQEQSGLQAEALKQAEIEKTGKVGSALAGVRTGIEAPISIGATGLQAAATRLGLPVNPLDASIQEAIAQNQAKAAQNPLSGTVGTIIPNIFTGGVGGVPESIAGALTAGSLKAAAPLLGKAATQTAQAGGINALVGGGIRKIAGIETTPADVAGDLAFGLLGGRKVELDEAVKSTGRKLFPILNDKETLASIRLNKTKAEVSNILADLGNVAEKDRSKQQRWESGAYVEVLPQIAPFVKKNSGVEGFLDAVSASSKERALVFKPLVKEINPALLSEEALLPQIEQRLAFDLPEPTSRAAALAKVMPFIQNVNTDNLLPFSGQLNDDLIRFYKSATPEASADIAFAKKAVRDTYSDVIRTGLQESGVSPEIYSQYGLVNELGDLIGGNFRKEKVAHAATRGKGFTARMLESEASLLTPRGLVMATGKAAAPLLKGEPGRLDSQINKIFSKITPAERITPQEFSEIYDAARQRNAALVPTEEQILDQQIQAAQQANAQTNVLPFNAQPSPAQVQVTQALQEPLYNAEAQAIQQAQQQTAFQRRLQELSQASEAAQEADILRLQKQLGGRRR